MVSGVCDFGAHQKGTIADSKGNFVGDLNSAQIKNENVVGSVHDSGKDETVIVFLERRAVSGSRPFFGSGPPLDVAVNYDGLRVVINVALAGEDHAAGVGVEEVLAIPFHLEETVVMSRVEIEFIISEFVMTSGGLGQTQE